eukprot:4405846-Pyramimonas_sp.AAC.1
MMESKCTRTRGKHTATLVGYRGASQRRSILPQAYKAVRYGSRARVGVGTQLAIHPPLAGQQGPGGLWGLFVRNKLQLALSLQLQTGAPGLCCSADLVMKFSKLPFRCAPPSAFPGGRCALASHALSGAARAPRSAALN